MVVDICDWKSHMIITTCYRREGIFIRARIDHTTIIGIPRRFLAQPINCFPPGRPFAIGYTFVIRSLVRSEKTRLRRRARVMFYSQELDVGATERANVYSLFAVRAVLSNMKR